MINIPAQVRLEESRKNHAKALDKIDELQRKIRILEQDARMQELIQEWYESE